MPEYSHPSDAGRIRVAGLDDLQALVALEERVFASDRISRRQFRHHIDSRSTVLLVCAGADDLLADSLLLLRQGSRVARLYSLVVAPNARGSGVGRMLLTANEQAARQRGCQLLRLEVSVDNTAAIALYERSGYRQFGRRVDYYIDGSDAWRYQKALD